MDLATLEELQKKFNQRTKRLRKRRPVMMILVKSQIPRHFHDKPMFTQIRPHPRSGKMHGAV